MSGSGEGRGDMSKLSVAELEQAYVESVETEQATEHIGRRNRLARHRVNIVEVLRARGEARSALERLAEHSNTRVRANAKARSTGSTGRRRRPRPNRRSGRRPYGSAIMRRRRH